MRRRSGWMAAVLGAGLAIGGGAAGRDTALDILAERYARGEIEGEEFQGKKRDLSWTKRSWVG